MTRAATGIADGTRTDSDALLDVLDRLDDFDVAWRRGAPPNIEDFLGTTGPTAPGTPDVAGGRRELLAELIKIDLEYRWNRPAAAKETADDALPPRPRLEDYLRRFPELGPPGALPLSLIGEEYRVRRRFGDAPSRAEFARRFEGHAAGAAAVLDAIGTEADSGATAEPAAPAPAFRAEPRVAPPGERFRVVRPHARGGLGEVFVAHDVELNRRVALKEIQGRHADRLDSRARFVREAEITGALEHPGIVPVYALGRHADGRPYYAMRFIKGESLKDAIDRFHDSSNVADPAARALAFRELLGRFVAVCNAIAFAHSKGVVHRDLKPANVMLGKYGETLVVDWGLAKVVGGDGDAPDAEVDGDSVGPSPEGAYETRPGQVFGTPAYMSPEQAIGDPSKVGPAIDIYSLGATLYHLLVGRPPVLEEDPRLGVDRVLRGDFLAPRAVNRDVPRPLEAICLKAMATEPEGRYESARALAEDIERWLAGAPVSAWREPWTVRAGRWLSRHRTAVAGAAAAAVVASLGLAAVVLVQGRANRLLARENTANGRLVQLSKRVIDSFTTGAAEDVHLKQPELKALRDRLLRGAITFYQELAPELAHRGASARAELAEAEVQVGRLAREVGDLDEAVAAYRQSIGQFEALRLERPDAAALRLGLANARTNFGYVLREAGDVEGAERELRAAVTLWEDLLRAEPGHVADRRGLAGARNSLGELLEETGRVAEADREFAAAIGLFEELSHGPSPARADRRGLANASNNAAGLLTETGMSEEAARLYRAVIVIDRGLAAEDPASTEAREALARALLDSANLLAATGHTDEAIPQCREAVAIWAALAREHPTAAAFIKRGADAHARLARLLRDTSHPGEANDENRAAVSLRQGLAREHPAVASHRRDEAEGRMSYGQLLQDAGRVDDAIAEFRAAVAVLDPLTRQHPTLVTYREDLARCRLGLAILLTLKRRLDEAIGEAEAAVALNDALVEEFPTIVSCRLYLAQGRSNLGFMLEDAGRHADAEREYRASIRLWDELRRRDPPVTDYAIGLARADFNLANVLVATGRAREATKLYRDGFALFEDAARRDPAVADFRRDLARAGVFLGNHLSKLGRVDEAIAHLRAARGRYEELIRQDPVTTENRAGQAECRNDLGKLLMESGRLDEAIREHTAARDLRRRLAEESPKVVRYRAAWAQSQMNVAAMSMLAGRVAEAERPLRDALNLAESLVREHPTVVEYRTLLAQIHNNLSYMFLATRRPSAAMAEQRAALAQWERLARDDPDNPQHRSELALVLSNQAEALRQLGRLEEARASALGGIEHQRAALERSPRSATYRHYLGLHYTGLAMLERSLRHPDAAAAAARERLNCVKGNRDETYNVACDFALCIPLAPPEARGGLGDEAMAALREAVTLGFRNLAHIRQDTDLDPLRGRDDFRALLLDLAFPADPFAPRTAR